MKSHFFADLHCHPSIKAFARSFAHEPGVQSANPKNVTSVWRRDPPSLFDKLKNYAAGLTNFIQSDAASLIEGRVSVVCLSFYPQEKSFFVNKVGTGLVSDTLTKLATEFGQQRIDHIQAHNSYWEDLFAEMAFLKQRDGATVTIGGRKVSYRIATAYQEIENADNEEKLGESLVLFIPTIEGAHVFDQVMNSYETIVWPEGVEEGKLIRALNRVSQLRLQQHGLIRPVFMTFAHHFWNGLCGHARSLGGLVKCIVDQENGINLGFSEAGKKMAMAMLEPLTDENGLQVPSIYIDIKHMSRQSRLDYFELLRSPAFNNRSIPVFASHAGVTGLSAPGGSNQTPASQEGLFMTDDINFFDDELLVICRTGGVFGIQMDERRIGSKQALRGARGNIAHRDILYAWAKLVWNQVRHIAELLDMNDEFAWGIQSLGTDYDGIIDPINGYWTAKELDELDDYLLKHAYNYLREVNGPCPLRQQRNKHIAPEEVVDRIMTGNTLDFLSRVMPA